MKKVGVYVFTHMVKKRETKKRETFFDGQNYIGLRYILSEIDTTRYEITYVSKANVNTVDYLLVCLISYYDVFNLINELHGVKIKPKVIIGGPGCINVELFKDIADVAIIGRGENKIMHILDDDERIDGLYYKDENYSLKKPLSVQPLEKFIEIGDNQIGRYIEQSIGCHRKCFFCEYSWKNKLKSKTDIYSSGLINRETRLEEVDWTIYKNKDLVTAIDGIDEATRRCINKDISCETIKKKINEIYSQSKDYLSLKLYCLLGYPFQRDFKPEETLETIAGCSRNSNIRLNVVMVSPHFMPMPFTPMENEPVNQINFRDKIKAYDFSKYQTGNVKVYWPWALASSPINAMEATVVHRAKAEDAELIKRILCSSKYKALQYRGKIAILNKAFGQYLGQYDDVLPYVKRTHPLDAAKRKYHQMVDELTKEA